MFQQIAYYPIFGKPLIIYLGILTLLSVLLTALIAILNKRGIRKIPFAWHSRMGYITIALALLHGLLSFLANL